MLCLQLVAMYFAMCQKLSVSLLPHWLSLPHLGGPPLSLPLSLLSSLLPGAMGVSFFPQLCFMVAVHEGVVQTCGGQEELALVGEQSSAMCDILHCCRCQTTDQRGVMIWAGRGGWRE